MRWARSASFVDAPMIRLFVCVVGGGCGGGGSVVESSF